MITASMVPEQERPSFYPSITQRFIFFEQVIYRLSRELLKEYHGAYWEFVTLDNGGKFAYPVISAPVTLDNPHNYSSGEFSPEAAGMCIWLIALSICAFAASETNDVAEMETFSRYHVSLMEYAREHSEWENIAHVID
ncbi:antirestriction protein [Vibrio parahaemolyticus]|nr:antirestriction protein [Vibrio parahaemolyticus]EHK6028322.1 antirestriction protein [Vibrio parahaemolyticus]EIA1590342.1 antirestriction protein [Vibrio parahaemolyticus]EIA1769334.1 antirestriction protein [Vibrio parahaemolyticus]EJG0961773.1 antirestriction protein [Vibrio parahaemolyticus]